MKAKVAVLARVNAPPKFPFITIEVTKRGLKLPVEHNGKVYLSDSILGFYVRYTENGKRIIEKLSKDPVEAFALYQKVEANHARKMEGKLPLEPELSVIHQSGKRTLATCAEEFEDSLHFIKRKQSSITGYMNSIKQFRKSCNKLIDDIDRKDILNFLDWLEHNLEKREGGHRNNTYRNRLRDIQIFLKHFGVKMPLDTKAWPKAIERKKEKYSSEEIQKMIKAASEDEVDLISFFLRTGFRDDEVAHAQYKDIRNGAINVYYKPEWNWTPKDNESRQEDIPLAKSFIKRMDARMVRHHAKPSDLIFPNQFGQPQNHLVRIIQIIAERAGVKGRIGLHKFRKTFGSMVANGKNLGLEKARIWLGHDSIETTQKYLAADEMTSEQSQKAVEQIFKGFGD